MILHVLVDNGEKSFPLTGIGGLLFLRYLQVRCNVTVELPEEIGCLKHLETLEIQRVAAIPSEIVRLESFKMKRFERVDGEYDPFLKKKNWIHEMGLSNERDDVVKILHAVSKEDLSDDQPAGGVVGKMPGDDALSNDQPGGVLGKMTWEDDLPNDQPARVLGKMPWEDDLSNDQPGGVLGNMEGEYMNKYDAYTRYALNGSPPPDFWQNLCHFPFSDTFYSMPLSFSKAPCIPCVNCEFL